ncbi:hypothetical protein OHB04_02185 [Streptomyces sp. NBC_01775]|uniref:hypothetical protein n=1 Tax=Streptomyces sp. NBC_01775 TaxID=2975939 RepID=UPI002DDADCA5|nr:hypothetical protein [Streptomyces sp. NBC_01775]WSB74701.1 hypothetical protein OHB04_02185 [Streptomyces sp. NBC_01775]
MTTPSAGGCERCQSAAAANEAIRRFVAGRAVWTPEALAELDRLWAVWRAAVAREMTTAA